jgi:hypothetical protein
MLRPMKKASPKVPEPAAPLANAVRGAEEGAKIPKEVVVLRNRLKAARGGMGPKAPGLSATDIAQATINHRPDGGKAITPRTVAKFLGEIPGDPLQFRSFEVLETIRRTVDDLLASRREPGAGMAWWRETLMSAESFFAINYLSPQLWDPRTGDSAKDAETADRMSGMVKLTRCRLLSENAGGRSAFSARRLFVMDSVEDELPRFRRVLGWHAEGDWAPPLPCRYIARSRLDHRVLLPRISPSAVVYRLPGQARDLLARFTLDERREPAGVRLGLAIDKDSDREEDALHWMMVDAFERAWKAATPWPHGIEGKPS